MAHQPLPAVPLLTLREPDLTNISVFPAPLSVAEYPLSNSLMVALLIPLLTSDFVAHLIGQCKTYFVSFIYISEKYVQSVNMAT